jgi:predicted amidophosphoribosyltransferase
MTFPTSRLRTSIAQFAAAGRDVLFPPVCVHCHQLQPAADPHRLCDDCLRLVAPQITDRCDRCSAPVGPHLVTADGCSRCRDEKWAFQRALSLGVYDGPLRTAILRMKQRGGEPLAAGLAELLFDRHKSDLTHSPFDAIVPVPHHWWNRLTHAHLPPLTIATALANRLRAPVEQSVVAKVRYTPQQTQVTATERRSNLVKAFDPAGNPRLDGLSLLVVDDVMTTGQTAHRVALALRKAGAGSVTVAVIARGIGA